MANRRLRSAILHATSACKASPTTLVLIARPSSDGSPVGDCPTADHQFAIASALKIDVAYLWPDARWTEEATAAAQAELMTLHYTDRPCQRVCGSRRSRKPTRTSTCSPHERGRVGPRDRTTDE